MTASILAVERVFHDFEGENHLRFTLCPTPVWQVRAWFTRESLEHKRLYAVLASYPHYYQLELLDQYGFSHHRSWQSKQWL